MKKEIRHRESVIRNSSVYAYDMYIKMSFDMFFFYKIFCLPLYKNSLDGIEKPFPSNYL